MKKYAILEDVIKKEFNTPGIFCRETGIPKSSLSMLISGKYMWDESRIKNKVNSALKKLRPDLNVSRIWDVTAEYHQKHISTSGTFRNGFKIVIDVQIEENCERRIVSYVEGY